MEQQSEQIKFAKDQLYDIKLSFDEPKIFTGGKYGDSIMYGGTMESKDIRFYASPGLHSEIKAQNLKSGDICKIFKMTKPGEDYTIFSVNGQNHKHGVVNSDASAQPPKAEPSSINTNGLEERIKKLEEAVFKKDEDEEIPF